MKGDDPRRFRVFVLGAGFSKPAGLPLAGERWKEVIQHARAIGNLRMHLDRALNRYVEYRRLCDGREVSEDDVDFEDFMSVLDMEHWLWLRGSDTWSDEGNGCGLLTGWG